MMLEETIRLFLDSRKRGMTGARRKAQPKTMLIYESNLRCFYTYLQTEVVGGGIAKYDHIKRVHLIQFFDWMDKKQESGEWAKATLLQVLRSLRTFFRWIDLDEDCQQEGYKGLQRWLPHIEKNPRRTDIPQVSDLKAFAGSFNTANRWGYRDYVATKLMMDTGIRLGEVCNLRIDHIKLKEHQMVVTGKTGPRTVNFTKDLEVLIKGWLKRREGCVTAKESPYLFVSKYAPQMDVNGFGQRFRKHCKKYGLPRISAHSLRHSFCTNYLQKGGSIERLRLQTGHSSFEMLRDYVHLGKLGSGEAQKELEKVSLLKDV